MYFKAVNRDLTGYGGYQFSVGKTHRIVGNVKLCANGFHFCRQLHLCLDSHGQKDGLLVGLSFKVGGLYP